MLASQLRDQSKKLRPNRLFTFMKRHAAVCCETNVKLLRIFTYECVIQVMFAAHNRLQATECDHISVDQFTFRSWERVNFAYHSNSSTLVLQDFSYNR